MVNLLSLRNLYITRLVLTDLTQAETGRLFGITGARVGVIAHKVFKRLNPEYHPGPSNGKDEQHEPRAINIFKRTHSHRMFKIINDYEKKHYSKEHALIQDADTAKDVIKLLNNN